MAGASHDHPHGHDHGHHPHCDHDHDHDHAHDHEHAGHDHTGHNHAGHDHAGHHHHHGLGGHSHAPADFGRAFAIGFALNIAYVAGEAIYGVLAHSLALLADAGHNLGDALGLIAAWLAAALGRRRPSARFTYGLRRSSVLAALANATLLLVVTGAIAWEAVLRLVHPAPAAGWTIVVVAAIGIAVNGGTALLFASGRHGDLNVRGAFAHMLADALVAAGVVVAGIVIALTGWVWVDPVVSLVVSALIVAGTWSLLRESLGLAMDGVPRGIDTVEVQAALAALPGVDTVHDLHIWAMSTTEHALTAHLVRPGAGLDDAWLVSACTMLRTRFGIGHSTLQVEAGSAVHRCELIDSHV